MKLSGWAPWLLVGALVWLVVLAAVSPMRATVHGDGYYTYLWARTIVIDGDLDFEGDYELCGDNWGLAHAEHGDYINQWNPGPALFWAPILAFDVLTGHPSTRSADPVESGACHGPLAERAVRGSLVAGWLTILLGFLVARRVAGPTIAAAGALAAGMLSPLAYYASIMPSYGHAASACMAGLAVYLWDRDRREPSRYGIVWVGLAIGLAMLTRPQNAILAILPLCTWLVRAAEALREARYRWLGEHVALGFGFVAATLLVFFPQMAWWHWMYGEWFFLPQGDHYMRWGEPRIALVLFSSANGLLSWSPALYLAFAGLVILAWRRETRSLGIPLLLFSVAHVYVMAAVYDWWGAIGFPARRADAISVPFMVGMAATFRALATPAARRALAGLALSMLLVVHGAWTTSVQIAVAGGARTDVARRSDQAWSEMWGRSFSEVWQAVGNPAAWPASVPYAIRYRMPIRTWDQASGPELFFHEWLTLRRREEEAYFDFVDRHHDLVAGFDEEIVTLGERYRRLPTGHGHAVVPISWPELGELRFELRVPDPVTSRASPDPVPSRATPDPAGERRLWVWLDGEDLGTHVVGPEARELRVPLSGALGHQGLCELRLRVQGGAILLRRMELIDPDPAPWEREAPRVEEAGERRRAWRAARDAP